MAEPLRLVPNTEQRLSGEQEMLQELRRLLDERQKLGSIVSSIAVFSGYALQAARAPSDLERLECIELRLQHEAAQLRAERDGAERKRDIDHSFYWMIVAVAALPVAYMCYGIWLMLK